MNPENAAHPNAYQAAALRYFGLRRRYWRFLLGGLAICVVFWIPLVAFDQQLNIAIHNIFAILLTVGCLLYTSRCV